METVKLVILLSIVFFVCTPGAMAVASPTKPLLVQLQEYASSHDEYPDVDGADWSDPKYTSFYKSTKKEPSFWSPKELLRMARAAQAKKKVPYETVAGMRVKAGSTSRYIIWTDLYGAFHSLVRALGSLREQGVVDDQLTILSKDLTFIFNGNVVDKSPYTVETLVVIMRLAERNPEKVIYVRGVSETRDVWEKSRFGQQVRAFGGSLTGVLFDELDDYFQIMPSAFYIADDTKTQLIRISTGLSSKTGLNEDMLGDFFEKLSVRSISTYSLLKHEVTVQPVRVRVLIEGREDPNTIERVMPCSVHQDPHAGWIHWELCSAQVRFYRQFYRFFYDSYATLTIATREITDPALNAFEPSRMMVAYRDVRTQSPWSFRELSLISGQPLMSGVGSVAEPSLISSKSVKTPS